MITAPLNARQLWFESFYQIFFTLSLSLGFLASLVFCQCEIPWRFGRICEISPIRHLLRLSLAISSGRRFENFPTTGRENSVFWLLLSRTIYSECNGTKHLVFLNTVHVQAPTRLVCGANSTSDFLYPLILQIQLIMFSFSQEIWDIELIRDDNLCIFSQLAVKRKKSFNSEHKRYNYRDM